MKDWVDNVMHPDDSEMFYTMNPDGEKRFIVDIDAYKERKTYPIVGSFCHQNTSNQVTLAGSGPVDNYPDFVKTLLSLPLPYAKEISFDVVKRRKPEGGSERWIHFLKWM